MVALKLLLTVCLLQAHLFYNLVHGCRMTLLDRIQSLFPTAILGSNSSLLCRIPLLSNIEVSSISWFFNDVEIKYFTTKYQNTSRNVLTVVNLTERELGQYQCMVTTDYGSLRGMPQTLSLDSLSKPVIILRSESTSVYEGDRVILNCSIEFSSVHMPVVSWLKQGKPLRSISCDVTSVRLSPMSECFDGPTKGLYLWNVSIADLGLYTCQAQLGSILKTSNPVQIEVKPVSEFIASNASKTYIKQQNNAGVQNWRALHIEKSMRKKRIVIPCGLTYFRNLIYDWDVSEINSQYPVRYNRHHENTVISLDTLSMGSSLYNLTCFAVLPENNVTNSSQVIHTTLLYLHEMDCEPDYNGYIRPALYESNITFASERCVSDPFSISTTWYHNGIVITNSSNDIKISEDGHFLTVINISDSLGGFYQKLTVTPVDSYMSTHQLTPRHPSELLPEVNISVLDVTADSISCDIYLNFNSSLFPLCGYFKCYVLQKSLRISEWAIAKNFINNDSPPFITATAYFSGLPANENLTVTCSWSTIVGNDRQFLETNSRNDVNVTTLETRPTRCPCFTSIREEYTSLTLHWERLSKIDSGGVLIWYSINWCLAYLEAPVNTVKVSPYTRNYTISQLIPGMPYLVWISCATSVGSCRGILKMLVHTTSRKLYSENLFEGFILNKNKSKLIWRHPSNVFTPDTTIKVLLTVWKPRFKNGTSTTLSLSSRCNATTFSCITEGPLPKFVNQGKIITVSAYLKETNELISSRVITSEIIERKITTDLEVNQECYGRELFVFFKSPLAISEPCAILLEISFMDSTGAPVRLLSRMKIMDTEYYQEGSLFLKNPNSSQPIMSRLRYINFAGRYIASQLTTPCNPDRLENVSSLPSPRIQCIRNNDTSKILCYISVLSNSSIVRLITRFAVRVTTDGMFWPLIYQVPAQNASVLLENERVKLQTASCYTATLCSEWSKFQRPFFSSSNITSVAQLKSSRSLNATLFLAFSGLFLCVLFIIAIWVPHTLSRNSQRDI